LIFYLTVVFDKTAESCLFFYLALGMWFILPKRTAVESVDRRRSCLDSLVF
jgi:hypothetical protein